MIRATLLQLMKVEMATWLGTGGHGGPFWALSHPFCKRGPGNDVSLGIFELAVGTEEQRENVCILLQLACLQCV